MEEPRIAAARNRRGPGRSGDRRGRSGPGIVSDEDLDRLLGDDASRRSSRSEELRAGKPSRTLMAEDKRARLRQWLESGEARLQPLTFPQRELWETSPVPVADAANHICGFIEIKGAITREGSRRWPSSGWWTGRRRCASPFCLAKSGPADDPGQRQTVLGLSRTLLRRAARKRSKELMTGDFPAAV